MNIDIKDGEKPKTSLEKEVPNMTPKEKTLQEMHIESLYAEVKREHEYINQVKEDQARERKEWEIKTKEINERHNNFVRKFMIAIIITFFLIVIVGLATFDMLYWLIFIKGISLISLIP